jgi:hypothetical protein
MYFYLSVHNTVAYRPIIKKWLYKHQLLLGNSRMMHDGYSSRFVAPAADVWAVKWRNSRRADAGDGLC